MEWGIVPDFQLSPPPLVPRGRLRPCLFVKFSLIAATVFLAFVFHQRIAGPEVFPCAWAEEKDTGGPEGLKTKETPTAEQQEQPAKPEEREVKPGFFDVLHGGISRRILGTADWLDSFFLDERAVKEENHTYVRFRYDVFPEEKSAVRYGPAVDLRLVLPQLQEKTHLVFSSEPAANPSDTPAPPHITGSQVGPTETRNVSAAVHYFFKSTAEESFVVRTGAVVNLTSPALFVAPRYRLLVPMKPWDFRFSQEVVYRTDTRWQAETPLDFERPLSPDFFFRTNVTGIWAETIRGYHYSLSFSLRQILNPTNALNYEWSNSYQTRPLDELTEIAFRVRYRHSFWREWLFFEIAPQLRFPRDRNFDVTPGILFRFESFFGWLPR
jgi:hypothetical protein